MTSFSTISDRLGELGDRGPVLGLRQLRHPVQGVRHPRHPAHRRGEDRRRRDRAPLHRPRAHRGAPHPVGPGRRLRRAGGVRQGAGRRARHDQLQHLPGRRLQARRADPHRLAGAAEGDRPPLRVHRGDARRPARGPEDLARRGHQLPRPGRHACPPGPARRGPAHHLRPARRGPAARARVQVLRAGVLPHRRPGLGHVVRPRGRPGRPRQGVPRHRPPRARHQHRVHRGAAAAPREARLVRLQQPLLRR